MVPTINHWIGQDDAIRRFKIALEASWNDGTKLPHMLFVGCPGTGKTLLANLASKEMGVQLHERIFIVDRERNRELESLPEGAE